MHIYRMLIVDDEPWILDGLSRLIDWRAHRVEIIGAVKNAEEAVRLVEKHKEAPPDILLTDIRMPGMDGFRLIEQVRRIAANIVSIILTGYSEFEYARKAIHSGVFEYLVKPVGKETLVETVTRLVGSLDKKRSSREVSHPEQASGRYSTLVKRAIALIEEQIFTDLSLCTLSDRLHVNPTYLCSVFRSETGEHFKHYTIRRKISAAKELFDKEPYLKIYEVSAKLNYSDPDYFARIFKKYEGVTPSRYKRGGNTR